MKQQNNKPDKLTDKAFSHLILTSFLGIIFCIVCLCSTTYALFTTDTGSDGNVLEAGMFNVEITATEVLQGSVSVHNGAGRTKSCTLSANGSYTVTIKASDGVSVSKGYCTVNIGGVVYNTNAIYSDSDVPFSFTVNTGTNDVDVEFEAKWGIHSSPNLNSSDVINAK